VESERDITFESNNLIIRNEKGKIMFHIIINIPNNVIVEQGYFYRNGVQLFIHKRTFFFQNKSSVSANGIVSNIGIVIGKDNPEIRGAINSIDPEREYDSKIRSQWRSEAKKRYYNDVKPPTPQS